VVTGLGEATTVTGLREAARFTGLGAGPGCWSIATKGYAFLRNIFIDSKFLQQSLFYIMILYSYKTVYLDILSHLFFRSFIISIAET
jgi:hypothetical protein